LLYKDGAVATMAPVLQAVEHETAKPITFQANLRDAVSLAICTMHPPFGGPKSKSRGPLEPRRNLMGIEVYFAEAIFWPAFSHPEIPAERYFTFL
jgi:hypothetical protein